MPLPDTRIPVDKSSVAEAQETLDKVRAVIRASLRRYGAYDRDSDGPKRAPTSG